MSDTPRTDNQYKIIEDASDDADMFIERLATFARQLERELAAAIRERDEWEQAAYELTDVDPATPELLRIWAQARIDDYTAACGREQKERRARVTIMAERDKACSDAEAAISLRDKYAIDRDEARAALREALDNLQQVAGTCWHAPSISQDEIERWRKAAGLQ